MPVIRHDQVNLIDISMDGADKVSKAVVIGKKEGWDGYALRVFKLGPGGFTPRHSHDWEHVNYITSGRGRLTIGSEVYELGERDFALVPPGVEHQFENPGSGDFEFICIVPERGEY